MKLLEKLNIDKPTLIVAFIFILALVAMLALTIHSVDVYNGTFP